MIIHYQPLTITFTHYQALIMDHPVMNQVVQDESP